KDAYTALKKDADVIKAYLRDKGIHEDEVIFSSVVSDKQFRYVYDQNGRLNSEVFQGYALRQSIRIESGRIDEVERISRESTELLPAGIEFSPEAPQYYYTRLTVQKSELWARASGGARRRAETIVQNATGKTGKLIQASMGVFQITGQHANEDYSYG